MDFYFTDEQKMIRETARKLSDHELAPYAGEVDQQEKFPREAWRKLSELGFAGLTIPEEYGGLGQDYVTVAMVMEEIGRGCMATAGTISVHLTTQYLVDAFGTPEQKQRYLPAMASGETIGALCLTESGSGSDAAAMVSLASKTDDGYLLNGTKIFITTGGEADLYIVYAKTDQGKKHKGISAFLVDKGNPGLSFGKKERKMGYGGSPTREVIFDGCAVSEAGLLGREGEGFTMVMRGLDHGRITVGAAALGIAQAAFDAALAYARQRVQFGRAIAEFQGIQWKFADMAMLLEASRLMIYQAAFLASQKQPFTKAASMAKCFATDTCMKVTTEAVQVFGGYGYMKDYPVERHMRDAKILQIVEGTNEIQRNVIARELLRKAI